MMTAPVVPYRDPLPEVPGRTPYTRPGAYLEKLTAGDYAVRQGRRPSDIFLVEKLRAAVDAWRDREYHNPEISDVTRRLFQFWFDEDHDLGASAPWRYWWCQREATETLVYLVEGRGISDFAEVAQEFGDSPMVGMFQEPFAVETTMDGQRQLRRWVPEAKKNAVHDLPEQGLLRYAFKIATGAGKTIVMAMAVVWSYFNRNSPYKSGGGAGDPRYADNFLIVAPNVIVYERLKRDFESNKIFHEPFLVPPEFGAWPVKVILRGDSAQPNPRGNVFLLNIQQIYESREQEWTPVNAVDEILGTPPKQDLAAYQPSMLERIKSLGNLMVLNDEAHHVHDDDLGWNKTLLALNANLKSRTGHGLHLWLDFSATPKTQGGMYYPWIVADYPLAQAVEDQIVKVPIIVHRVKKVDPEHVNRENVVAAYHDWIVAAVARWQEHRKCYEKVGKKPVLFVMCERTTYADVLAEDIRRYAQLKSEEVLVIHTDATGQISESESNKAARDKLQALRNAARDVDEADKPIKVIVSVLMLREGWDVHNVTVILGLRPFTARAEILPEQSVGRGLRLMSGISPDRRQTLEVVGTRAFEEFVKELEHEGVGIVTVDGDGPPMPVQIYPVQNKIAYDIELPLTKPQYVRQYRDMASLDVLGLDPLYTVDVLDQIPSIDVQLVYGLTQTEVDRLQIQADEPLLAQEPLRAITQIVEENLNASGHFAQIYPLVSTYVARRCFGVDIDLEAEKVIRRLRDPNLQRAIADLLAMKIAELTTHPRAIEFENAAFRLSETRRFTWPRQHVACDHTVFNLCAVFNPLELRFAQFLDKAPDIVRFAALAEAYTRFRIDYLSRRGAMRFYYPDFVAIQEVPGGQVNWILETKGRPWDDVPLKTAAAHAWCEKIGAQTGQTWKYLIIHQPQIEQFKGVAFSDLLLHLPPTPAQMALATGPTGA